MVKAFISGSSGPRLTADERAFFGDERPWGYILFRRNCESRTQVAELCADFRSAVDNPNAAILIDQEGGRVQRLGPPEWRRWPVGRRYGELYAADPQAGLRAAWLGSRLMARDLHQLGINVDCLPVLDVPVPGAHDIIGDRAYSPDPQEIALLARAAVDGLLAGGVLPVGKHVPGHGRAAVDSHLALPRVEADWPTLLDTDLVPFRALADLPLAMTAHVVYAAIDAEAPATTSPRVIRDVIRGEIGFQGCLMSDDLSMRALSGTIEQRAKSAFAAGCDLALHCNGDFAEMRQVAAASLELAGDASVRATAALARLHAPEPLDLAAATAEFDSLLGQLTGA